LDAGGCAASSQQGQEVTVGGTAWHGRAGGLNGPGVQKLGRNDRRKENQRHGLKMDQPSQQE